VPDLIPTSMHPHNLDQTARIVWSETTPLTAVYKVPAGYIATVDLLAHPDTFATLDDAKAAVFAATGRGYVVSSEVAA